MPNVDVDANADANAKANADANFKQDWRVKTGVNTLYSAWYDCAEYTTHLAIPSS